MGIWWIQRSLTCEMKNSFCMLTNDSTKMKPSTAVLKDRLINEKKKLAGVDKKAYLGDA